MVLRTAEEQLDYLIIEDREKALAKSYIAAVAKDPNTFIDLISSDDEMYLFTQDQVREKENALFFYFRTGRESLQSVENVITSSGKSFKEIRSFLDFASGYGRVTRFLIQEIEASSVWVSDIYKKAVAFQKNYFKVNGFYSDGCSGFASARPPTCANGSSLARLSASSAASVRRCSSSRWTSRASCFSALPATSQHRR